MNFKFLGLTDFCEPDTHRGFNSKEPLTRWQSLWVPVAFFLESSEPHTKKCHQNRNQNLFLLRLWWAYFCIRFRGWKKNPTKKTIDETFMSISFSDFFSIFSESSETYADPSLGGIRADTIFRRHFLSKNLCPRNFE